MFMTSRLLLMVTSNINVIGFHYLVLYENWQEKSRVRYLLYTVHYWLPTDPFMASQIHKGFTPKHLTNPLWILIRRSVANIITYNRENRYPIWFFEILYDFVSCFTTDIVGKFVWPIDIYTDMVRSSVFIQGC